MAVKTGVMGSSEPALVFSVVASLCSLQRTQTLKTNSTDEYNTVQCNRIHFSEVHLNKVVQTFGAVLHRDVQEVNSIQYKVDQNNTIQYCTVQCSAVQYNTLHYTLFLK